MTEPENFDVRDRPHISISAFRATAAYNSPTRPQSRKALRGDYTAHAAALLDQLTTALGDLPGAGADQRLRVEGLKPGSIVEIETIPAAQGSRVKAMKVPAALEFPSQEIVVLQSTRNEDRTESALLFVPDDARAFLRGRISDYGRTDIGNQRRPDLERFEVIETVRAATVEALFVGDVDFAAPDVVWWELWAREPASRAGQLAELARGANLDVHATRPRFRRVRGGFVW